MILRFFLIALGGWAAACSSSSSPSSPTTQSHEDASRPIDAASQRTQDAGPSPDARPGGDAASDGGNTSEIVDAGAPYDGPVFTLEAGITWSSLYRDYFGNPVTASCSGDGNCHGSTSAPGYLASGYLCPADASAACFAGITSSGADLIEPDAGFANDYLSMVLCQDDGNVGTMPYGCSYSFTTTDLERIRDWVQAGAQDN